MIGSIHVTVLPIRQAFLNIREALLHSSYRRKPVSMLLIFLDPGFRRDDVKLFNQIFLIFQLNGARAIENRYMALH